MKKEILVIFGVILSITLNAQNIEKYSGKYENGTAEYEYYENNEFERIFNGYFNYKGRISIDFQGACDFIIKGSYKNNKKDGKWSYTISDGVYKETIIGQYKEGLMNESWLYEAINSKQGLHKKSEVTFSNNKLTGKFYYNGKVNLDGTITNALINGFFNDSCQIDSIWKITYIDWYNGNIEYEDIQKYKDGVLYWRLKRVKSTGEIIEKIDNSDFINNFNSQTNTMVVDNIEYEISNFKIESYETDLIRDAVEFWTNSDWRNDGTFNYIYDLPFGHKTTEYFYERKIIKK